MRPLITLLAIAGCSTLEKAGVSVAESFVAKEARSTMAPDISLLGEKLRSTNFQMDLLNERMANVQRHFEVTANNVKALNNDVNKYIIDQNKMNSSLSRRIGLLEKNLNQNASCCD